MSLHTLPDEHPAYVPGHGETTVGEIVTARTEGAPKDLDAEQEASLQMWEDIVTRNLLRAPWERRVSISDIKAYHASQSTRGQTRAPQPRRHP